MAKAQPITKADAPATQVEQTDNQATAGADPAQNDPEPSSQPLSPQVTVERCDVRVLAAVTIGDTRYQPDEVIEGLPVVTAKAHQDSVDPHPEAVAYARSLDTAVHKFE